MRGLTATDGSFTSQTQDIIFGAQGFYDFLLRQHASSQGRWLAPDPAGLAAVDFTNPQTWNRYAYVANNPLGDIDPLGLSVLPVNSCGQDPMCWGAYAQSQNSSHASGVNQGPRASWEPWGPLDLLTVFTTTDEGTGHCLSCVDMFLSSSGGNGGYLQNLSSFDFSSCGRPQLRGRIAWRFLWWCNGYELRKSCSTW
jgi:RHS repeat-associated protein